MDYDFYKRTFEAIVKNIPRKQFDEAGLEISVHEVMESIALKIYKPKWSGDLQSPLTSKSRIFFSVWVNDKTNKEEKLYYNIHALKLRELKGYKISSRDFAEKFRNRFIEKQNDWENVSIDFGPLTLMEGWLDLNAETIHNDVLDLSRKFLKISPIIEDTLKIFKS